MMTKSPNEILLERVTIECNSNSYNPESTFILEDNWAQIITPNVQHSSMNAVFRSKLTSAECLPKIKETLDNYRAMKVPFRWIINPFTEPSQTEELLKENGLKLLYEADAMLISAIKAVKPFDEAITIRQVTTSDIELYVDTFVNGWDLPAHQVEEFRKDMRKSLTRPDTRYEAFIAYKDNQAVGTGGLIKIPSGAYLAAGTVLKNHRGQGIYKALLSHRAQRALDLNISNLFIHAKLESSQPICKRLGFESVFVQKVYSEENY